MKIVVAHNGYRLSGGEDSVVASEIALLEAAGHQVLQVRRDNHDIDGLGAARVVAHTFWSTRTTAEVRRIAADFRPDVIHAHNTFPLLSPSLYWAAGRAGIPVVQTLHNFRLACPQAMFLRDGRVCEDCLGHLPWRGVVHRCYRGSAAQSAVLAGMLGLHRAMGTWRHRVTRYIALNEFCRDKFVEMGLPADRLAIKPNFVERPAPVPEGPRRGILFVGRLAPEKGVWTLADAMRVAAHAALAVAGEGPEAARLDGVPRIRRLGHLAPSAVGEEMRAAMALVVPSIWYENFPRTIVEAFSRGLPVIASRIGALAGIVDDGRTGLLVPPGDPVALARALDWAVAHPAEMAEMGVRARAEYLARYTPEHNLGQLLEIYGEAIDAVRSPRQQVQG